MTKKTPCNGLTYKHLSVRCRAPRRVAACSSQPGGSRRVPGNLPKTLPCDFASSTATELTKLVVRYNVGVQVRETFELKQIDEEEFEE